MVEMTRIEKLARNTRHDLRAAVNLAVQTWPNAHLGSVSPREDIRSAFTMIRREVGAGQSIQSAIGILLFDAYRHADM